MLVIRLDACYGGNMVGTRLEAFLVWLSIVVVMEILRMKV